MTNSRSRRLSAPGSRLRRIVAAAVVPALALAGITLTSTAASAAKPTDSILLTTFQAGGYTIPVPAGAVAMDIRLIGGAGGKGGTPKLVGTGGQGGEGTAVLMNGIPLAGQTSITVWVGANGGNGGHPGGGTPGKGYVAGGTGGASGGGTTGGGGGGGGASALVIGSALWAIAAGGGGGGGAGGAAYINGGAGGSNSAGKNKSGIGTEGTGGAWTNASPITTPATDGQNGKTGRSGLADAGGGGGGGGLPGGQPGAAGKNSAGGGGAAGASQTHSAPGVTTDIQARTSSMQPSGTVEVWFKFAPTLTATVQSPVYAGQPSSLTATITTPSGFTAGGSLKVDVPGLTTQTVTANGSKQVTLPATNTAGTYPITLTYTPSDSGLRPVTWTGSLEVRKIGTTTTLTGPTRALIGATSSYSATISAADGSHPTGTATLVVNGSNVATTPVTSSGSVSFTLSTGPATAATTVSFTPSDVRYTGSTSNTVSTAWVKATTSTTVNALGVHPGQPMTATATVSKLEAHPANPTGGVTFTFTQNGVATTVTGSLTTGSNGTVATGDYTPTTTSPITITAAYAGDTNFLASTSATKTVSDVTAWSTTVAGALSDTTAPVRGTVSYGVTVAATGASDAPIPTGTVQLHVDGAAVGDPATLTGGMAVLTVPTNIAAGPHAVSAVYTDATDVFEDGATEPSTLTLTPITSDVTASVSGPTHTGRSASVVVTVTTAEGSPAEGSVVVEGVTGASAAVVLANGTATVSSAALPAGESTLTTRFTPADATRYAPADGSTDVTATAVGTSTELFLSTGSGHPGEQVSVQATVTSQLESDPLTPEGTVTFTAGDQQVTGTSDGYGVFSAELTIGHPGTVTVSATYAPSPEGFFAESVSAEENLTSIAWPTTVTGTLSPTSVQAGRSATLNVVVATVAEPVESPSVASRAAARAVAPVAAAAPTPVGQVQLIVDGSAVGAPVALDGTGAAALPTPTTLSVGSHVVSATYIDPAGDFAPGATKEFLLTITAAPVTPAAPAGVLSATGVDGGGAALLGGFALLALIAGAALTIARRRRV